MDEGRRDEAAGRAGAIGGVILAAGRSSRMGRPKALLPLPGGNVITSLVRAFRGAGIDPVHVVIGHGGGEIASALAGLPVRTVWNDLHPLGQTTSLQAGLRSLPGGLAAALLSPADYPLVTPADITPLIEAFRGDREGAIYLPAHGGRRGHPFLVAAECFAAFLDLPAGEPGRTLVRALSDRIRHVELPGDGVLADLDTPAQYAAVLERLRSG